MTVPWRLQTCYDEAEVCGPSLREACAQKLRQHRSLQLQGRRRMLYLWPCQWTSPGQ